MISPLPIIAAISVIGTLHSDIWPSHGHFQVSAARGPEGQTICQLESSAHVGGDFFALVIRGPTEDALEGVFMSNNAEIGHVQRVEVALDDEQVLSFPRAYVHTGKDLTSVVGLLQPDQSAAVLARLRERAATAKELAIIASPYSSEIPASGLSAALNDFDYCLEPLIP
jgi:hypothetical protein